MSGWGEEAGGARAFGPKRGAGSTGPASSSSSSIGTPSSSGAPGGSVIGSGGGAGGGSARDPIKDTFLLYQQHVALYGTLSNGVGTHQDSQELRSQLKAQESVVQEVGQKLEGQLSAQLRGTEGLPSKSDKDRVRAENKKLNKDFQAVRQRFSDVARKTAGRVREADQERSNRMLALSGGSSTSAAAGGSTMDDSGLQVQLQQEAIDERILQEREEEIMKINQSVVKVNEIFKDLAEIVNKQQEDIDIIATNVEQSHDAAKRGLEQVEKAAKYQPGCCLS